MKKIIIWVAVTLFVLIGIGIVAGFMVARSARNNAGGMPVRTQEVTRGDLTETISAPGTIEPKSKVSISAKTVARIIKLPFREGDKVNRARPEASPPIKASMLVQLDATDLEAQLRSARARYAAQQAQMEVSAENIESTRSQITSTQVQLADAERDLARQKKLLNSSDVSQAIVDTAQAKVDQMKASVDSAQHNLEGTLKNLLVLKHQLEAADADIARATDNVSYTVIESPIDGIVTRLNAEVGEMVVTGTMNNAGTVIMEVADLSKMLMKARVDESSIANVKVGQKATVRIPAYKDREFEGLVTSVALAQTTDPQAGGAKYFKTEILLETKGDRIVSGLNADADIQTAGYQDVITIPSQAVVGRPTDGLPASVRDLPEVDKAKAIATVVYRLVDGKALVTPVQVGASDLTKTVIKSGLKEGESVIVGPFKTLETISDQQMVKPEGPATKPTTKPATKPTTTTAPSTTTSATGPTT